MYDAPNRPLVPPIRPPGIEILVCIGRKTTRNFREFLLKFLKVYKTILISYTRGAYLSSVNWEVYSRIGYPSSIEVNFRDIE